MMLCLTAPGCRSESQPETQGILRLFDEEGFVSEGGSRRRHLAFSAPIPSARGERVTVPDDAILRWRHSARDRWSVEGVVVSVSVREGDSAELVYEGIIKPTPRKSREWQSGEVDLTPWAGRLVEITFEARYPDESDRTGKQKRPGRIYWSSPFVASRLYDRDSRPSVVLVLVDTLRADRLGVLGAQRELTPRLDALAKRGALFDNAFSQTNWTLPAAASLFTGLYPVSHGVTHRRHRLKRGSHNLARLFASNGYVTAGFHDGGYLSPNFGFSDGFDQYTKCRLEDLQEVIAWIESHRDLPFFLFIHTYAPHAPYNSVPEEYWGLFADDERLAEIDKETRPRVGRLVRGRARRAPTPEEVQFLEDLYDGEVRYVDDRVGELETAMERLDLLDRTLIAVTSDHGEEFGERGGFAHGAGNVHVEVTRIPLILAGPGIPNGARVSEPVQLTDLLPTLADLIGFDGPARDRLDGRSLFPLLHASTNAGTAPTSQRLAWSEGRSSHSIRSTDWTLIVAEGRAPRLYDRGSDPLEMHDVAPEHPETVEQLTKAIRQIIATRRQDQQAESAEIDGKTLDELRALGYIE